jgi:putative hydrolase of the HAD superfamily
MNARPGLDAVICDAGGTLIRLDFEWMAGDLLLLGFPVAAETLRRAEVEGRRAYDASARPPVPADASGPPGPAPRGDVRAYFGGTLAAAGVPEALRAEAIERFLAREKASGLWCRPMEGARVALDALAATGLRLAVVSNSDGRAERHLENADMLRGIEFVVDSHLVGIEKPDPAIFAVALGRLGTLPERTLFVGDIRSVDEAGAEAAGMRFVLLDPLGDYGASDSPRIAGMHELAGWVATTFEVGRPPQGGAGAGEAAEAARRTP